jgi:glycosyltransferase involved in cell wall biosynthesis
VGLSPDVLEHECIYLAVDEAIKLLEKDIHNGFLNPTVDKQYQRVVSSFSPDANVSRFRGLYENISNIPVFSADNTNDSITIGGPSQGFIERVKRKVFSRISGKPHGGLRIGLWHEFHKPPYGGGNQFMMALKKGLEQQGVSVSSNRASSSIDVHICNSAWFNVKKFESLSNRKDLRIIHRVDGPIAIYRSSTWEEDNKIYDLNNRFAAATVYQSGWCYSRMLDLDFKPVRPVVIKNAIDGSIFNRKNREPFRRDRKIRLISTAWSPNPKKGGPFYKALEGRIDWDHFEYTFVGQTDEKFERIKHLPAQNSENLANILKQHDIYIMASQSEACSNALIEALACGLPALYLDDGGNGEVTGLGGLPFKTQDDAVSNLDRIVEMYEEFQASIWVESLDSVTARYIDVAKRIMDL